MTTILGLAGSLRRTSFNRGLLRAAADVASDGITVQIGTIDEVPLYHGDHEDAEGLPPAVAVLQNQLRRADALLLVTPEYNGGIPGVFKNAIDWMSRGEGLGHFRNKPVAVIGASPGGFGTLLSQNHWLQILRKLGMQPWFGSQLIVSRAGSHFDAEGNLTDEDVRNQLGAFLDGFAANYRGQTPDT